MIQIKKIAFIAYPVSDMKRAREFYENILGLKPSTTMSSETWQEYDLGDATLSLGASLGNDEVPELFKCKGGSLAFEVENLDEAIELLKQKNIPMLMDMMDFPTCRSVAVNDPDQNVVFLHQLKSA